MDAGSQSVFWYRRSKPLGKLKRRVQELRIPSSSYYEFSASRPTLDLSHNESVRLAADCLLSQGLEGYQEVLNAEGEVDFLSDLEKNYIKENGRDANTVDPGVSDDDDKDLESSCVDSQSPTQCPAVSTDSDTTVAALELTGLTDVKWRDRVVDKPCINIYFQSDSRGAGMKDLVREFIRKARTALVIVMDTFSDVELLCDLLEASRSNVSVYLLLDHLNLNLFVSMWLELQLDSKNFPKLSVRSVDGQTYCAKTGRKLTGQIAESFIIADWNEVLTGSYSFSWLSWQVHRSLAVLVKGSTVTSFHQEFHRLHCSSRPVPGLVTVPHTHPLVTTSHAAQNDNTGISRSKSSQNKTICWASSEDAQAKMPADVPSGGLSNPQSAEFKCSKGNTLPLHTAGTQTQTKPLSEIQIQTQLCTKTEVQAGTPQSVSVEKPKHAVGAAFTQHDAKTNVESLEKNQNQTQSQSSLLGQTHISHIQPQLSSSTVTTAAAENTAMPEDSNTLGSLTHAQHRTVHYQSPFKTNSNLDHHNVGTEALFRHRHRMTQSSGISAGLNTQRGQWSYLPNFLSDNLNVPSPSMSQQQQIKAVLQFPLTHPRGHTPGLETNFSSFGTRWQDQTQRHRQPPLQSQLTTESPGSKSASTCMRTHHKAQLQTDSKLFLPATGTQLHLQPRTSQQSRPSPGLNWSHAERPRPVARHSSFGSAYGIAHETSGQLGWRAFHNSRTTLLGRSKSMTDSQQA